MKTDEFVADFSHDQKEKNKKYREKCKIQENIKKIY